jgi:hypothetical protein
MPANGSAVVHVEGEVTTGTAGGAGGGVVVVVVLPGTGIPGGSQPPA